MTDSPESNLQTDAPSTDTSTSDEDADSGDEVKRDVAPDPESTPTAPSESDMASTPEDETAGPLSSGGISNPPDMDATETTHPSNDSEAYRKTQTKGKTDSSASADSSDTKTETVLGEMADEGNYSPRGDGGSNGGDESGAIFDDTDVTKWGFIAFMGFETVCAGFAALVLYAISNHGVHHTPWILWTLLGVLIFAFLAAAFGGLAAAKSMMDTAGGLAEKSQSRNSKHD